MGLSGGVPEREQRRDARKVAEADPIADRLRGEDPTWWEL